MNNDPTIHTVSDLARAVNLPTSTLYGWIDNAEVPAPNVQAGKRRYYSPDAFDKATAAVDDLKSAGRPFAHQRRGPRAKGAA